LDWPHRGFSNLAIKFYLILKSIKLILILDISPNQGITIRIENGKRKTIQADNIIIITLPLKPGIVPPEIFVKNIPEIFQIGNSREPGYMYDAIADGYRIGYKI
jgi:hypothetical protein